MQRRRAPGGAQRGRAAASRLPARLEKMLERGTPEAIAGLAEVCAGSADTCKAMRKAGGLGRLVVLLTAGGDGLQEQCAYCLAAAAALDREAAAAIEAAGGVGLPRLAIHMEARSCVRPHPRAGPRAR